MTPKQVVLVKNSWARIVPIADQAAQLLYQKVFELEPPLQPLFTGDMTTQGRKIMSMIDTIVNSLDRIDAVTPAVEQLGEHHAEYGVRIKDYATLGRALLWALETLLGEAFTADVKEAWSTTYHELASAMHSAATVAA